MVRGPVVATNRDPGLRNAMGAHGGSYCVYRALAVASGTLDVNYMPKYDKTAPAAKIGPNAAWFDAEKVSDRERERESGCVREVKRGVKRCGGRVCLCVCEVKRGVKRWRESVCEVKRERLKRV